MSWNEWYEQHKDVIGLLANSGDKDARAAVRSAMLLDLGVETLALPDFVQARLEKSLSELADLMSLPGAVGA